MSVFKILLNMISYHENPDREGFILKETEDDGGSSRQTRHDNKRLPETRPVKREVNQTRSRISTRGTWSLKPDAKPKGKKSSYLSNSNNSNRKPNFRISASLEYNREELQGFYNLPLNADVIIRDFTLGTMPPVKGFALYITQIIDIHVQNMLFQALMLFSVDTTLPGVNRLADHVKERLLPGNIVNTCANFRDVLDAVNNGDTAIFLEGLDQVVVVETKGCANRNIDRPAIEQAIRAPQEGFGNNIRDNISLVRKHFKNENLMTERMEVGERNRASVSVMYLRGLTNPDLVAEVKRRIKTVKADLINDSGILEQFIEDYPYSLFPQVLATERPDRIVSSIVEGKMAIFVDGGPFVLVVPSTIYDFMNTGEENYLRWQYGTFIRYIRALAACLAVFLPGVYLALVLYHHEMIPTELLLAIAGTREGVPFPSIIEVLIMEFSFELVREAGLRVPGFMGATIGIVGALILGQAAVQAHIISPILVILVAVTGLSSFALPNYSLQFALRISRFIYIALGATLGFFGITIGLAAQIVMAASIKSFGVIMVPAVIYGFIFLIIFLFVAGLTHNWRITSEFSFPFYQLSRTISLGRFFQRVEPVYIIVWGINGIVKLGITLYAAAFTLAESLKLPDYRPFIWPLSLIIFILSFFPPDLPTVVYLDIHYLRPGAYIPNYLIPLALLLILWFKGRNRDAV